MSTLDAALRSAPTPLLVLDASDRIEDVNEALALACDDAVGTLIGASAALGVIGPAVAQARATGAPVTVPACACLDAGVAVPLGEGRMLVTFGLPTEPGALRASEVLSSITDAFFALDRDWRFTYVNPQAEPLLERAPADLVGKVVWDEFPEAVGTPFWEAYQQAVATGEVAEFDAFFEPLDRHFAVRAYPFSGGLSVYFADVTARKRAEESIRTSNERYRVLVESINDGFCVIDMVFDDDGQPVDYRFVETNPAFEEQAGFSGSGRTMREIAPDLEQHWFDMYGGVATTGVPVHFESHAEALGRWYNARATRLGGDGSTRVAILFTDVTARKQAEAALQASEARYRFLSESLQQQIWTAEPDGNLDYVNRYVSDYFGRSAEAMIGSGWQDAVHPDDLSLVGERWGHSLATGEPYQVEFRLLHAGDQSYRWHIARADAQLDDGTVVKWFGANVDVHEQKEAEEALRASEAQARLALDAARLGLWTWDPATDAGTQDERTCEIFGISDGEALTMTQAFARIVHPDDLPAVQAAVAAATDPAGDGRVELEFQTQTEPRRWVRSTARTTFVGTADARRAVSMVGTIEDVTERRALLAERDAALERLRQSEERHRIALEGGGMGTWEWDIAADRLDGDDRAYRLWGSGQDEVESVVTFYDRLVHPDDLPALQAEVERTLAEEDDYTAEFRIVRPGGHVRWTANRGRIVRDASGTPVRMFGLSFDVTDRREAEEALRRKNVEMEQFAYTISHDLKSPLVTITGFLGLLKGQVTAGQTDRALASADRVLGAADRMGRLIGDLLHLSRAGRVTGDAAPVELDALVGGLAEAFGPRVEAAGGTLDVAPSLGTVLADDRRLGEVVENLLANAVTYGLGGGGTRITVRAEPGRGGGLRLLVEDDGPGVPDSYRDKVFELFQRLGGEGDGTGIGLALVARIMETTGGSARVESAGGPEGHEGARFVLEFPASAVLELPAGGRHSNSV